MPLTRTRDTINIQSSRRNQLISISDSVRKVVRQSGITDGLCFIYVPHTTAGITINEDADPDVALDIEETLEKLVPRRGSYRHAEGNADAHVKASLMGTSVTIHIENGELQLGRWQGIFFCEFDGPRHRSLHVTLMG